VIVNFTNGQARELGNSLFESEAPRKPLQG
jgi:hypothetical protein